MMSHFKIVARSVIALSLLAFAVEGAEGFYVGGLGGAIFVNTSTRTERGGTGGKDKISFEHPGYVTLGSVGYGFENNFRTEGEISYRRTHLKEREVIHDGGDGGINGRLAQASGNVAMLSLMANVFYDFNLGSKWKPYIGGGIGSTQIRVDEKPLQAIDNQGTNDEAGVFVYQIGAGIGYKVSRPLTILLDYRYFNPSDPHLHLTDGTSYDMKVQVHNVGGGLRYHF